MLWLLLLALGVNSQAVVNGDCASDWTRGTGSCYYPNATAVTRDEAWDFCNATDTQSQLVLIYDNSEGAIVTFIAGDNSIATFWSAGTRNGFEVRDGGYVDYADYQPWKGGSRSAAGWDTTGSSQVVVDGTTGEWEMSTISATDLHGFICEVTLDSCYTNLYADRTTWIPTTTNSTATLSCPSGYTGTQTRYCTSGATFNDPITSTCSAIIDQNGWNDDTQTDGFAWLDASIAAGNDGLGPFKEGTSHTKSFVIQNSTDGSALSTVDYPYIYISFSSTSENAFDGTVSVSMNGNDLGAQGVGSNGDGTYTYVMTAGRDAVGTVDDEWDLVITAAMAGEDPSTTTKQFYINNLTIAVHSRQDMAESCYNKHSFNESISYPYFNESVSGFMSSADDLTFVFSMPRQLYDIEIEFVDSVNDELVGYTEADANTSYWTSGLTADSRCGEETWTAAIPWVDLTGVFTSVETFQNGSAGGVDNSGEDYYVFIATLNITAKERLVATSSVSTRTWEVVRESTWRYPFALKWLRDVNVQYTMNVMVCSNTATICTIRHVAAIITFVQTEVNPIANVTENESYGKVVLGIQTKVAYPYMFISGAAEDDPFGYPFNVSAAAASPYDFQASNHSIVYTLDSSVGSIQSIHEPTLQFMYEDANSCTHDDGPVEASTTKECEQNWALTLQPKDGACYINGLYTITFAARCMYNKPVCVFQQNGNTYQNTVATQLSVTSTQMCPSLVENIDLTGSLCTTGRSQDGNGYTSACATDPTYVQGETTHFISNVASTRAAIIETEITQIYATQDFSTWQSAPDELLPRYDSSYSSKALIWSEGNAVPYSLTWTPDDGQGGVAAELTETVVDVSNSDTLGVTTQAGFQVNLNPYIFPAPHDRSTDIMFTVVLRVTYEGFNNFNGNSGILSGDSVFGGSDDHTWCSSVCIESFANNADTFCAQYSDAQTYCPGVCDGSSSQSCTRRRNLAEERRALQEVVSGGDDFMSVSVRVSLNPQKAEINGHVDAESHAVRFSLNMEVDQSHIDLFNENRPLYYSTLEYKLAHYSAAIEGQFKVKSMTQTTRGDSQAFSITIDIDEAEDVSDPAYSPASVASKLEMMIQTGKLYEDPFFGHTEIYAMHYEAVDDSPDRVHFGQVTPIEDDLEFESSSAAGISIVLSLLAFLLW